MKYFFATVIIFLSTSLQASSIAKIKLSELEGKSDLIVLAKVIDVISDDSLDKITIKVSSVLKGKPKNYEVTVWLRVRGGLKEFDPETRVGDYGVFFLKKLDKYYRTAQGGSIAIFEKNYIE